MIATTTINLNHQQRAAVDSAIHAVQDAKQPIFRIGGYAGTGKTTVARHIVDGLNGDVACCAFTGKAAQRLREKGLPQSKTIHKTIYKYIPETDTFELIPDVGAKCFLIDEGSMVDTRLLNDMQSFGQPIIAIGDPGQLEPVGKDPRLMHTPDIVLDQIHRQAEGSGIIQFATAVRKDYFCPGDQYPDVSFIDGRPLVADLKWADIVLCGFNRTRGTINSFCRKLRGFNSILEDGEQIIILKNNYHFSVFNGQIVTVKKVLGRQGSFIKAHCDIDGLERELRFFEPQFGSDKEHRIDSRDGVIADYGYCITCHKSQGSEWDNVLVIDEQCNKWEPRRWRYTAITRAAIELRYCWKNKG